MNTRSLKKHLKYIVPQIRLALIKEPGNKTVPVSTPGDIEKLIEPLKHYSEEHFISFHLNSRHEVSGYHIVSHGTLSASLVHPREVFKSALLSNSHSIVVAHNHPGGSLTPSAEDLETTRQLIEAGKLLGVPLVDHVIVSHSGYVSLRETRGYFWI
jgi:DNA repair protein RadC